MIVGCAARTRNDLEGAHSTPYGNLIDQTRPLWEVARATSAAPTFFPAFCSSRSEVFVDGGVLANNPSLVGYLEVRLNFRRWADDVKILNLGTEGGESALPCERPRGTVFTHCRR